MRSSFARFGLPVVFEISYSRISSPQAANLASALAFSLSGIPAWLGIEAVRIYFCVGVIARMTATVLCARSQDSVSSVSGCGVHVVFSTVEFKDGGKLCPRACETVALRRSV